MKASKVLATAVLAIAIGAPIAVFVGDISVSQPTTSTGVRVPFLHRLLTDQVGGQSELASLERADAWLNSPPLTPAALGGKVVLVDSGPTPASTGCARFRMFARGLRNTVIKDWW